MKNTDVQINVDSQQQWQAENWLAFGTPDNGDLMSGICIKAAHELGRRTNFLPLILPLVMLSFISVTPQLMQHWMLISLLYTMLLLAVVVRIFLARKLAFTQLKNIFWLIEKFQMSVDIAALCWGGLVGMLIFTRGLDSVSELALIASLAITSGAFTSLTMEMSLWMRFNLVLWIPIMMLTMAASMVGYDHAWFLLLIEVIFVFFAILQGRRVVREYINGLLVQTQLEQALHKIEHQNGKPGKQHVKMLEIKKNMQQLSNFDQLTGTGSRQFFYERLEMIIEDCKEHNCSFAILHLDLDGFKDINDNYGHDAGDQILKIVAHRLSSLLRNSDFAARLSSDELVLIINNVGNDKDVEQIVKLCLKEIHRPISLVKKSITPKACIGVALYPQDGENTLSLLKASESAMHTAKSNGSHRYARYTPPMTLAAEQRVTVNQEIRYALTDNQFELYYQPQVDNQTHQINGVEALIRWQHPVKGMMNPAEFIHVAENAGLIDELGEWVLNSACFQAAEWFRNGIPEMTIAVNISPLQLLDPNFVTTVCKALDQAGLPAELLELEITESAIQTDLKARETLVQLRQLGIRIAVDDFGTGDSSLASIKELPIDRIKIDRMLVIDMLNKTQDIALLGAIVEMAHVLGCSVVVEGVEDLAQVEKLRSLKCDCLQGHYFSRPVEAWKIPELTLSKQAIKGFLSISGNHDSIGQIVFT